MLVGLLGAPTQVPFASPTHRDGASKVSSFTCGYGTVTSLTGGELSST